MNFKSMAYKEKKVMVIECTNLPGGSFFFSVVVERNETCRTELITQSPSLCHHQQYLSFSATRYKTC